MSEAGVMPPPFPAPAARVVSGVPCVQCGYDLTGLPETGACPECGAPIERSLQGWLLRFSNPAYLAKLHRGVFLVVAAIIAMILLVFIMVGSLFALGTATVWMMMIFSLLFLAAGVAMLVGWWLFSTPDPRHSEAQDSGRSRQVVRVSVAVYAACTLLGLVAEVAALAPAMSVAAGVLDVAASLIGLVAWIVLYFASMLYLQWLAPAIPSEHVRKRARLLMWLGPVLMTVGIFLFMLGPLIALVLYWNLLDHVRKELKAIRASLAAR